MQDRQSPDSESVHQTVDRRHFLRLAGAATVAGSAAVVGAAAVGAATRVVTLPANLYPMRTVTVVDPTSARRALRPGPTTFDIGGATGSGLGFNGLIPGPMFTATNGSTATIDLTNDLAEATTVHWHGLVVPTASDGQPQDTVAAAGTRTYTLPINQRASLNWYHPHPHMKTGSQVALGLSGLFVVRDAEETALGLPSGAYEVPIVLRDFTADKKFGLTYSAKSSGYLGTAALANGTRSAYHLVDKAVYRLRLLNSSNARVYALQLSNGASFTLIGNDGGLLPAPVTVSEIALAPAERIDVLVDLRTITQSVHLRDATSGWSLVEFRLRSGAASVSYSGPPATLSTVTALSGEKRTRTFTFDGMTQINGTAFNMTTTAFTVPQGDVERWVFSTGGNGPHPVHVHGASFQVQSRTGGRATIYPWERGWKDTVLLNDGERVEVLIRFNVEGRFMIHCHKLEHEDGGMMMSFLVGPAGAVATPTPMASASSTSTSSMSGHHHGG
ncbi:MAG: multicopper oxidase family protein [Ilumatobacteraceae bacterium]